MKTPRTIRTIGLALMMSACVLGALPRTARAQDAALLQREDDDEERLRRWMAVRAARSPDVDWAAWIAIPLGTIAVGGGITLGVLQQDFSTTGVVTLPSALFVILGAAEVALGIVVATVPNLPRDAYRRIPDRRLTEREIGRLEGLLHHEAESAALGRTLLGWLGGGLAVGGLGAMPLIAAFPPEADFDLTASWVIAGAAAGAGLIWLVTSLFESPSEADWREYQRGLMPRETPQISVRPTGNGFLVAF